MKKYILAAFIALAFAPIVSAQEYTTIDGFIKYKYGQSAKMEFPRDFGVDMPTGKSFGYSKNISKPFNDGTYFIKLESFATGTADVEDRASDIVLVLDVSGSMNSNYTTNVYEPVVTDRAASTTYGSPAGSYDYNLCSNAETGDNARFIRYEGKYYPILRGRTNGTTGGFFLYFTVNGTPYYLDRYEITTTMPTGYTSNQRQAWWGYATYRLRSNATRLHALKESVVAFIDEIQDNDLYMTDEDGNKVRRTNEDGTLKRLGNRVSIVKYAGNIYDEDNLLTEGNHKYNNNNYNNSELVINFTDVDDSGVDNLIKALAGLTQGGATRVDYGLRIGNAVLAQPEPVQGRLCNKTVVMFTDGEPTSDRTWDNNVANAAINNANTAKTSYKAKVFAVGILTNETDDIRTYMNRVSSNYRNATSMTNTEAVRVSTIYYINATSGDLKDVFVAIAKQSGGSSAALSSSTSNVDVVSNSFILPPGTNTTNIGDRVRVFTAPLDEIDEDGNYIFGTETLAGYATDTYDVLDEGGNVIGTYKVDEVQNPNGNTPPTLPITVTLEGTHGIKVTNFDYTNNWCGPIKNQAHQITGYHGHKIIILIPIMMDDNAVGGPNVETNAEGSGIYAKDGDDDAFVEFKSPTVSLPVNIHIEKTGLEGKESARFMIERAILPESGKIEDIDDDDWVYVTTVFVTNSEDHAKFTDDGNPIVRIRGLAANKSENEGYIYRVTEENWSWSYSPDTTTNPSVQYTDTNHITNPFTFDNDKKDRIDILIRHAESKVKNVFKGGGVETQEYDDSKNN
jgi:hypothetical protein